MQVMKTGQNYCHISKVVGQYLIQLCQTDIFLNFFGAKSPSRYNQSTVCPLLYRLKLLHFRDTDIIRYILGIVALEGTLSLRGLKERDIINMSKC